MIRWVCIVISLYSTAVHACLDAYQFKVFPVGIVADTLVTVDAQIYRKSIIEGSRKPGIPQSIAQEATFQEEIVWRIAVHVAYYHDDHLIRTDLQDTSWFFAANYIEKLRAMITKILPTIQLTNPTINMVIPLSRDYCPFVAECDTFNIVSNELNDRLALQTPHRLFSIKLPYDTTYYHLGFNLAERDPLEFHIGTIRRYETSSAVITIVHLGTGSPYVEELDEIPPYKFPTSNHQIVLDPSDRAPDIHSEAIFHHGFGFDVFMIVPKL
jgi:hypothetical protein